MTAATIIRNARHDAGISQALLAERVGIAKSQIARWETSKVEPSFAAVLAIVRACGMDLAVITATHRSSAADPSA